MTFISAYIELFIRGECHDTQRNEPSRKQGSPNYYLGKCPLIDMNSAARCRYMIIIREPCGLLIDLCSLKHVITCKHGKNEDFNIFTKTSVKNYLFVCRKREYSSIVQYSLLYRQVTFFKHFHPDPPYSVLPSFSSEMRGFIFCRRGQRLNSMSRLSTSEGIQRASALRNNAPREI